MANIRVDVDGVITNGQSITFIAPCNCSEIEKLKIYYIKNGVQVSELFTMKDSLGKNLSNVDNLFCEGAYIKAILDTVNKRAYLQNAATSGYLEEKVAPVDNLESDRADIALSAKQGKVIKNKLTAENGQSFQFAYDDSTGKYGFKAKVEGADTFFPFSRTKIYKLTGTSAVEVPEYQELTVDNFYYVTTAANYTVSYYGGYYNLNAGVAPKISGYNPQTGQITVTGLQDIYDWVGTDEGNGQPSIHKNLTASGYILCVVP